MKIWDYLIVIGFFLFILYFVSEESYNNGYNDREDLYDKEAIKKKDESIKIKKKQQKIIVSPTSSNHSYRIEWLQWVWKGDFNNK